MTLRFASCLPIALPIALLACASERSGPSPVINRFADERLISYEAVPSAQPER